MTSWKRKNKENHKAQISISCCMRAEKTQSSNVKDIHRNIYQSEITDEQWFKEKAEALNKWKSFAQRNHHIRKHYTESLDQEVKIKWIEVNINHIVINVIFCWEFYKWSKCFTNTQENTKQSEMWTLIFQQKKLWILQYNIHKFRNKMIITLLHEKKIKNYDILILQELWWFDDIFKAYCSVTVDFMLKNNEDKICFYINKKINSNIWHSTWHFKDVNTITL